MIAYTRIHARLVLPILVIGLQLFASLLFAQTKSTGGVEIDVGTTSTAPAARSSSGAVITSDTVSTLRTDDEAVRSAEKIIPASGTNFQSTEQPSLGPGGSVAAPPSLQFKANGQVVLSSAGTSESVAVQSAAEILKMIGLKPPAPRPAEGYEIDEESTATRFDVDAVERLIGRDPTVVYRVVVDGTPLPDPMIVPWIRNQKLLEETFNKALEALAANKLVEGREMLLEIVTQYPNTEYAQQSREILEKILKYTEQDMMKKDTLQTPAPVDIQINPNVKIGAVIADASNQDNNRVMINGRVYKPGDTVRSFPNHKVIKITEALITIEVEQSGHTQQFDVPVRPNTSQ